MKFNKPFGSTLFCRKVLFLFLALFVFSSVTLVHSEALASLKNSALSERIDLLKPQVSDFFYEAESSADQMSLKTGKSIFHARYRKKNKPSQLPFRGYSLNSDPFHVKEKKISFLLGADCSHFVHRFLQLMGANFYYARSRHMVEWSEKGKVVGWGECRNRKFSENFESLGEVDVETLQSGDLLVWPKARGSRGLYGHVVVVLKEETLQILHAKNHRDGIVKEALSPEWIRGARVLRWKGPLQEVSEKETIPQLLAKQWDRYPDKCSIHALR